MTEYEMASAAVMTAIRGSGLKLDRYKAGLADAYAAIGLELDDTRRTLCTDLRRCICEARDDAEGAVSWDQVREGLERHGWTQSYLDRQVKETSCK